LNDEVASVLSQAEALVLQQSTERALDRPAMAAQAGPVRLSALVDERVDLTSTAEVSKTRVGWSRSTAANRACTLASAAFSAQ